MVSVSAAGTSPTWLPTRGSRGVQVCGVWRPAVLVNEVWAVLAKPLLLLFCSIAKFVLESCISVDLVYIKYIQHKATKLVHSCVLNK